MSRTFTLLLLASSALLCSLSTDAANTVINGDFSQVGPSGNPVIFNGSIQQSGWSAAAHWQQFKVVPSSYLATRVEPIGIGLLHELHVWTNGGPWPPSAMGNGFAQSFPQTGCATASFWVKVTSGQVTGNLISAAGPFVSFPQFTATGGWKQYTEVAFIPVTGIGFETLIGPGAEYHVTGVQVQPCLTPIPIKDLSQYLAYDPFYYLKNPGGPVEKIRVTNRSNETREFRVCSG